MIAKPVVWAPTREEAVARADRALAEFAVEGPGAVTSIPLLRALLAQPRFAAGEHGTGFVDSLMSEQEHIPWSA